ncbi:MAG: hypothetical protein AB1798_05010 [Spirochaetota bacterium]
MDRKKIVIVGGGSNLWAPNIVKDMMLMDALADSEFVLYDIDKKASDLVAGFLKKLNEKLKTKAGIVSTSDRKTAFEAADYFVITISTGGLKAMARDISIPEEYGIYHTVGDTCGPAGWARTIRNFQAFVSLAEDINRYAKGAVVLNYSNPIPTLTGVLARVYEGPVVGLCHGLFNNLEFIKALYKLPDEREASVKFAGLNHFFWIKEARTRDKDIFTDLKKRVATEGFTKLFKTAYSDSPENWSSGELATALFNEIGFMPYLGDRHTCEFFPYYITSKKRLKQYKLRRTTVEERARGYQEREKKLRQIVRATSVKEIPRPYFFRSREAAADIIAAHKNGNTYIDVGNLPNIGQISNLGQTIVVETAVLVDRNGFSPIGFGPLPQPVLGLIEPHVHLFLLTLQACFQKDKGLALRALRLDPSCSHLDGPSLREMGRRLLQAHRGFDLPF